VPLRAREDVLKVGRNFLSLSLFLFFFLSRLFTSFFISHRSLYLLVVRKCGAVAHSASISRVEAVRAGPDEKRVYIYVAHLY